MLLTSVLLISLLTYSDSNKVLSPQNVSVYWKNDFEPEFSWMPPKPNCLYEINIRTLDEGSETLFYRTTETSFRAKYLLLGGGKLFFSVTAICDKTTSSPAYLNVIYPDLVNDLRCVVVSANETICSWQPSRVGRDVQFFYWFNVQGKDDEEEEEEEEDENPPPLRECPSYNLSSGMKTGCTLPPVVEFLHILLNSTGEEGTIRNTFLLRLLPVALPPLKMTVIEHADKLIINWTAPEALNLIIWEFKINYTECNEVKTIQVRDRLTEKINRVSHCPYGVSIRAESERGNSQWSEPEYIEALSDLSPSVYFVLIPVALSVLMVVALVCCSKYQDVIFPKVPEPKNLLDGNRNKVLLTPAEEEQSCDVFIIQDSNTACGTCDSLKDS